MKAITLHQPWASLMALGFKRNETRGWPTDHRGSLAIHAGANVGGWGRRGTLTQVGPFLVERVTGGLVLHGGRLLGGLYRLPLGAVVAIVSVYDVTRTTSPELAPDEVERALGDYSPGRWAWQTGSLDRLLVPVPAKGSQQFWDWEPPVGLLEATRYHRPADPIDLLCAAEPTGIL